MLVLQKSINTITLKSIKTAHESRMPCCAGAFRTFRIFPHLTIRHITSRNKVSYRFLPDTYIGGAIRRSAANQMTIGYGSCLKHWASLSDTLTKDRNLTSTVWIITPSLPWSSLCVSSVLFTVNTYTFPWSLPVMTACPFSLKTPFFVIFLVVGTTKDFKGTVRDKL